jgi:predicted MPP superfamily phosphohydrolase
MRLAWLTDIHLNFVTRTGLDAFLHRVARAADAVVVTGDIAESPSVVDFLVRMERRLRRPVYFVLGNHDCYRGSIAETRLRVAEAARRSEHLVYLNEAGVVELSPTVALVGHDGWADARLGDFDDSDVLLNDYLMIDELFQWRGRQTLDKPALRRALQGLGDEAARHFDAVLPQAARRYRRVIAATHVPPFHEATWHDGRLSDGNWLPHFSSRAAGDAMRRAMESHPDCRLVTLCGHTHGAGEARILPNLRVLTGGAQYGEPAVQRVFVVR